MINRHFKVNFSVMLPDRPSDFKRVFFDRWVTHWEFAGQKWVTQKEIAYEGFGDRKLIYRAYNHSDLKIVFHDGRFYRLEDYGNGFYVRVDSEYQTLDQWHFVLLQSIKGLTRLWTNVKTQFNKWFKRKPTSVFDTIAFPIVRQVHARTLAFDLVSVQPLPMPKGVCFYLDYKFPPPPGTQLTLDFPIVEPQPAAIQLKIPFPIEYDSVYITR